MPTLTVKHLQKFYQSRAVVKDVSLTIGHEIVGLLGPNGAGKTTSFYMIVGLIKPDKGQVFLNDLDISHFAVHERARAGIGYLPQETSIFRGLTVADNIKAVLQLRRDLNREARQQKLESLLNEFHIAHLHNVTAISLSGGEKRRVEIARALAMDPQFILLDEPFAGIDPIAVMDIKKIILQLRNRGIGILITDHNVRETLGICEKAYIVCDGEIITMGNSQEILQNQRVREVYLGEAFIL